MVWDEEKVLLLKDEYPYADLNLLAKKLGTTTKAVRRKAEKLRLKRATNNQIVDGYKYCSFCKVEHPVSSFYRNKAKSYGYEYHCKKYYESKKINKSQSEEKLPLLYQEDGEKSTEARGKTTERMGHSSKRPRNPIVIKSGVSGKICNSCKIWKPLSLYWNSKNGIAGKRAVCIDCFKAKHSSSI